MKGNLPASVVLLYSIVPCRLHLYYPVVLYLLCRGPAYLTPSLADSFIQPASHAASPSGSSLSTPTAAFALPRSADLFILILLRRGCLLCRCMFPIFSRPMALLRPVCLVFSWRSVACFWLLCAVFVFLFFPPWLRAARPASRKTME